MENNETTTNDTENLQACLYLYDNDPTWNVVCEGVISVIIAAFGIIGNLITGYIISKTRFNDVFHRLIMVLAMYDFLFLGKKSL